MDPVLEGIVRGVAAALLAIALVTGIWAYWVNRKR